MPLIALTMYSCTEEEVEVEGEKVARVGEVYLTLEELENAVPDGLSEEDSLLFLDQYKENWIKEQIVLQKAEEVLPQEAKDVNDRLEKYRRSLIIFAYEQQYIKERLDTVVAENEIVDYYNNHQEDFMLKDYIVKVLYLKFSKGTPGIEKVDALYKLENEVDINNLRSYADLYAVNFYYDPNQWLFFDDVLKEVPLQDINKLSFIRKKKKVSFEEGDFVYYINVMDSRLKDAISPLSFEREKIKSIILNLRTRELREHLRESLYQDAHNSQNVETY